MKQTTPKAIIFCRVSSKEQEDTGYSLDAQEKLLKDYAGQKGFEIARIFKISESASGKQIRKAFNEMLQIATKNKVPVVLCEKIDRLTRTLKAASTVDDWVKEDVKREVHFVKEAFVLNQNTKAHENLVWDMKVAIARFYTNNLSEEVRKGQKEKLAQGWLPTKPPLGYKTTGEKGHKTHFVDEGKAPLIRKMFELYATGNYSLKELARVMCGEGLRSRSGGMVGKSRMHDMLSDPFYCGKMRWKDVIYPGEHKPLISKGLFDEVQKRIIRKLTNPQYRKHYPVFKAKINCGECGATITWEIQKGHWYGHHSPYEKYKNCTKKLYMRQEKVEEQLFPFFDQVAPKDERVLRILEKALNEDHADESNNYESQRKELNTRFERMQKRLEVIYEDKLDGKIPSDFYERKFKEYSEEKENILHKLDNLNDGNTKYYEAGYSIHELALNAKDIYNSEKATHEEKRLLLSYAFSDLTLRGDRITPNYSPAFEFLATWMPRINKIFEPTQNPTKGEVSYGLTVTRPGDYPVESLEPQKKFRTSKNPYQKAQSATFGDGLRPLLAWQDAFRTYDWAKAIPVPELAIKHVNELLALV